MNQIDVSIIYVNYKTAKLLEDSIKSVRKYSSGFSYEIIVVDNSCDDAENGKLEQLRETYGFKLFYSDNVGFGSANNLGVSRANGKYLHFVNCDTLFISNACFELFIFLENHPTVGIVGSNLYSEEMDHIFSFQKNEKNLKNEKKDASIFNIFRSKSNTINKSMEPTPIGGFVSGASLMISKCIFNKVGGFPKEIFLYAEEAYLCYQLIHKLNLEIYNIPSSKIIHLEGKSFGISEARIRNSCDGNFVYYNLLFGQDMAIKYLKTMVNIFRRNEMFYLLTFKNDKKTKFSLFKKVYKEKLLDVQSKKTCSQ